MIPPPEIGASITHVILAFLRSDVFHADELHKEYPLFTPIEPVRSGFGPATKVMVAIGGWGDSLGFEAAARTEESRKQWALQIKHMVDTLQVDGVDIDWEYPGYLSLHTHTHTFTSELLLTHTFYFRLVATEMTTSKCPTRPVNGKLRLLSFS